MVRHYHCTAAVVAVALALGAAAPASARFDLNPSGPRAQPSTPASANVCSEVCSGSGYAARPTGAALPHDPRARAEALAGAGHGYGTTPAAYTGYTGPRSEVVSGGGYGNPIAPATVVRVVGPSASFDWGDAGIGAGGALALMTLLIGGTLCAASIRRRTTRSTA